MDEIRAKRTRELKVIGWIVLGIIIFAMLLGAYRGNNPAGQHSATEASKNQTKKLTEEIQDPVFARIFVEQYLRHSLRDPDSLVIENITPFNHQFRNGRAYYAGTVQYRAKNGFGGYNRERATILIDTYNENDIRIDLEFWKLAEWRLVKSSFDRLDNHWFRRLCQGNEDSDLSLFPIDDVS